MAQNISARYSKPQLKAYIHLVEKQYRIPSGLLAAVAFVESGYQPYAVNISGRAIIASNQGQALYHVQRALKKGVTNIDIGVMQINYNWHKENFANIEEMLSPKANIIYAARMLCSLRNQHGNWHQAIRYYHSSHSFHHRKYSRKVVVEWLKYV